ncbi:nascent polypeptide-associated complex protein [archaeon]|nr:nascent polypeptide-associated complex protein [archaeon]
MFPSINPRDLRNAMKRLGIKEEAINAKEVIIKTEGKDLVIREPKVTKLNIGGEESLQITGAIEEYQAIKEEDIQTVASQADCSYEEAKRSLEKSEGDLAKAIMELTCKN